MEPKNIIFKHTLKDYNKRYRYHKNLLKFTKKEVEEFDRQANTIGEHYVLRKHKWWFIDDTYYQVPKTLHRYWFRNLNAGVQTTMCLLGAGVIATGASMPKILELFKKEDTSGEVIIDPSVANVAKIEVLSKTSEGAIYKVSPKDSTQKKVTSIKSVYIGNDKLIEDSEYTYKALNKNESDSIELTIKQVAFSKHKGAVKVLPVVEDKTPSHVVTKAEWISKADEWVTGTNGFCNSTLEYTEDQLTYKIDEGKGAGEQEITITKFEYTGSGPDRVLRVEYGEGDSAEIGNKTYSGTNLNDEGCLDDNGIYEIYDNEIIYKNENATGMDEYKELHINKYGYPTYEEYGDGYYSKCIWDGDPTEPSHEVTKEEWISKADEWVTGTNGFCNSTLEYTQDQLTYKVDEGEGEITKTITKFEYKDSGENRCLEVTLEGESDPTEFASKFYSGNSLNTAGMLKDEGVYEIYDNEIVYRNENETSETDYKELHINKYGYPTYEKYGDDCLYETIWNGDPTEPSPEYTKYLEFVKIEDTTNALVHMKSGGTLPSEVTIPSTVDGKYVSSGTEGTTYTITQIDSSAFEAESGITKVNLPDTITFIDECAFDGCDSLATINMPSSLQYIGEKAFNNTLLTSFVIPSTVTYIGSEAFGNSLTTLTFEDTSKKWIIDPEETTSKLQEVTGNLATTYNSNNGVWAKNIVVITNPNKSNLTLGDNGTVTISSGTISEIFSSDSSVLAVDKSLKSYVAGPGVGSANLVVKTTDVQYGLLAVTVDE